MDVEQVARCCHELNRAYCESLADYSQLPWHSAERWQQESAAKGVQFKLDNPDAAASSQHEAWSKDKIADGWVWGAEKDAFLKTHPCLVAYEKLPVEQRIKDYLFQAVVSAFVKAEQE